MLPCVFIVRVYSIDTMSLAGIRKEIYISYQFLEFNIHVNPPKSPLKRIQTVQQLAWSLHCHSVVNDVMYACMQH